MEKLNVNEELNNKMECLKRYLVSLKSVAVAFSSGVDSTFLLKVAHEVLGDRVIAVTAKSMLISEKENWRKPKPFVKKRVSDISFVNRKSWRSRGSARIL